MNGEKHISLNDPVLLSRLRGNFSPKTYNKRPVRLTQRLVHDVVPSTINITKTLNESKQWDVNYKHEKNNHLVETHHKPSHSKDHIQKKIISKPPSVFQENVKLEKKHYVKKRSIFRLDRVFVVLAVFLFATGLFIAFKGLSSVHIAQVQAQKLTAEANKAFNTKSNTGILSTTKPSGSDLVNYVVPVNNPRLITIPKLGVHSRIFSVGTDKQGMLKTPSNIHDTAWYNQSSLPGQPGATLIDGHISSWTSKGVFYNLKNLAVGDTVSIERGDGKIFNYSVVNTKIYDAQNVDMGAAMTPIVQGTSGLNLISCYGKVKPGTSEFTQRIVVFTKQVTS